ncbi:ABC transporter substrate-binding protein [Microbacterium sp. STN6]|uniref:ABC transporter substrate-binding protein n=1 Tax=Microbacterium sp. STN6 TaxID=2995588 RepID=UPI002260D661|nr:ABC transporter substrate-binding protein [Microbacterium sp. STN6]MCX7522851.1 ABC transporter substrate-binding protein [Microbacterium sp. STN6]
MYKSTRRYRSAVVVGLMIAATALTGCSAGGGGGGDDSSGPVTLTWFSGAGVAANTDTMKALAAAYHEKNPNVTIKVDASGPSGSPDIDNVIKTKLATGAMPDMFWYNSGSLLAALNPDQTMLNVKDEDFVKNLDPTFVTAVSSKDGVYGVPVQSAGGGGIFYNIPIYKKLGLDIPKTWDEFLANAKKIKDAGYDAVEQTYGDAWTSQVLTLADFYNINASDSDWAKKWTENKVNFADDPVALQSFTKLQDLKDGGFLNKDFASAKLDDGLKAIATGTAANYPMLGFAEATIVANFPEHAKDVGFFGIPGDSANSAGMTVWEPSALYAPKNTKHPAEVKNFMAFVASKAGCDTITKTLGVTGAYVVKGCTLPSDAPKIVADMLPYFDSGKIAPALEFLSPVKGPNLASITVEVGSGIRSGEAGAKAYDDDSKKQAQQLGLPGW